ncbi:hypothetical protein Q7C36_021824 [Tachysurus vachellii]|uniref:Uncharacterized protein n=1 Tax=Tachysurus vachellii TaxID=175792 RepID=A0AA88IS21_TACVA|nr:hypothetical protein Q7C36_021824 [Tachysurus vachellii]
MSSDPPEKTGRTNCCSFSNDLKLNESRAAPGAEPNSRHFVKGRSLIMRVVAAVQNTEGSEIISRDIIVLSST